MARYLPVSGNPIIASETPHIRPDRDQYYMAIGIAVRARANCLGSKVGAVIVRDDRIVSTGYNGTAQGLPNCEDGGCQRCENRGTKYSSGEAYDLCICVHAEQNAILSAARFGTPIEGTDVYTTLRPCFNCTKELVQARVAGLFAGLRGPDARPTAQFYVHDDLCVALNNLAMVDTQLKKLFDFLGKCCGFWLNLEILTLGYLWIGIRYLKFEI